MHTPVTTGHHPPTLKHSTNSSVTDPARQRDFPLVCLFLFRFRVFLALSKPRALVQSFLDMHAPRQPHTVTYQMSVFSFVSFLGRCRLFRVFCIIAVSSLAGRVLCTFFFRMMFFLPSGHELDLTSADVRVQSIDQNDATFKVTPCSV